MARDLTEALRALTESGIGKSSRRDTRLPAAPEPPAIPARTGKAGPTSAPGAGGIASPLTETDFADREFYATGWTTADGLFTLPAIKTLKMRDANDQEVVFEFKEPV
jgi:hypothetical protein